MDSVQQVLDRIAAGFENAADTVPVLLSEPRAHPREVMLLALIAGLTLLVLVTLAMIAADAVASWARTRRSGIRIRRRASSSPWIVVAACVLAFGTAIVLIPSFPSTSRACGLCHATEAAEEDWAQSVHAGVGCAGCHAAPGAFGRLESGLRGIARRVGGDPLGRSAFVDSRACLACHEDIATGVLEGSVSVRHSDIVEAHFECVSCHESIGHGEDPDQPRRLPRKVMSSCLLCHDGDQASAECDTCHRGRPSDMATEPADPGSVVIATTCEGGCHKQSTLDRCVDCHGLVLPHPVTFVRVHAEQSAADPGLCARCHESATPSLGCGCHPDGAVHGSYSTWFGLHGTQAAASGPGGCLCHDKNDFQMCRMCHDSAPW